MRKIRVYLAGDLSKNGRWRKRVIDRFAAFTNVEFMSPVDTLSYDPVQLRRANKLNTVFVDCDLTKVQECEILFVYLRSCGSRHSGSSAEVGYATALGKLVILVNDMPASEEVQYGFIKGLVPERRYFRRLEDGIEFLEDFLLEYGYVPTGGE